jgi:hypothetical protein
VDRIGAILLPCVERPDPGRLNSLSLLPPDDPVTPRAAPADRSNFRILPSVQATSGASFAELQGADMPKWLVTGIVKRHSRRFRSAECRI